MSRFMTVVFTIMLFAASSLFGQLAIESFDSTAANNTFLTESEGPPTSITMTDDHSDFTEGDGSLKLDVKIGEFHQWGSYNEIQMEFEDLQNWAAYDTLNFDIKVHEAPSNPEWMIIRFIIVDEVGGQDELWASDNKSIVRTAHDWMKLSIPLYDIGQNGSTDPDSTGFRTGQDNWNWPTNNKEFDLDKIRGYRLTLQTAYWNPDANIPADSLVVGYDNLHLSGSRPVPFIIFNGMTLNANFYEPFAYCGAGMSVAEGAGATEGTNALEWTFSDGGCGTYNGTGWNIGPPQNLLGSWMVDTLTFKMKAASGAVGMIRIVMESGANGKVGAEFTPTADGTWHDYAIPYKDFIYIDDTNDFDTSAVTVVQVQTWTATHGEKVYIDDWWSGNPDFDVIPPDAPTNLAATADTYFNIVSWTDVPGETKERYNVYASLNAIVSVDSPGVELVEGGVIESESAGNTSKHYIYFPNAEENVTYHYAVVCIDAAGNSSEPATGASVQNLAKAIPTISIKAPEGFAADGDFSDWDAIGTTPFNLKKSSAFITYGAFDDDDDLDANIYLAIDSNYLYIAADVIDDDYDVSDGNWWERDVFELFIGLYEFTGKKHTSLIRGDEPDYKIIFNEKDVHAEIGPGIMMDTSSVDYYYEVFGEDHVFEAKISLDSLAGTSDKRFYPVEDDRILFTLTSHDRDNGTWEGNLSVSPYDKDNAYQTTEAWIYTWLGVNPPTGIESGNDIIVNRYELHNNYPNPFNPSTTISYFVPKAGEIKVEIFNVLGQKVMTLFDGKKLAGEHKITFNAKDLASGIYFYRLKAGSFNQTKKMILMK